MLSNRIPLDYVNKVLVYAKLPIITPDVISKTIFLSIISFVVTGLTLPIRSICWTLWYMGLSQAKTTQTQIAKPKRVRRKEEE